MNREDEWATSQRRGSSPIPHTSSFSPTVDGQFERAITRKVCVCTTRSVARIDFSWPWIMDLYYWLSLCNQWDKPSHEKKYSSRMVQAPIQARLRHVSGNDSNNMTRLGYGSGMNLACSGHVSGTDPGKRRSTCVCFGRGVQGDVFNVYDKCIFWKFFTTKNDSKQYFGAIFRGPCVLLLYIILPDMIGKVALISKAHTCPYCKPVWYFLRSIKMRSLLLSLILQTSFCSSWNMKYSYSGHWWSNGTIICAYRSQHELWNIGFHGNDNNMIVFLSIAI